MNRELEQFFTRREYFNRHLPKLKGADRRNDIKNLGNTCPSCGYPTLDERNTWEICGICFWEDDGQDDQDADKVYGGPNSDYSLTAHRLEWDKNLKELKKDYTETARNFRRIDELIELDQESNIPEIMKLIDKVSDWFDEGRKSALQQNL
ncbi:hypothetical protein CJ739_2530 [Mariniflexile rhizosphaerae]|uniref:CPCC family cysteine-rich protein n=1 Tax=unclassified Mariniflexile TaxID=2643887 RepID=UPI000CB8A16A|nr:CPCC family cysteine-rich protein [Mariniflexile sp. TRM1-10]AXP81603.1 hypothetical protein CJ739_2530 [Mariniflexile sp. TRM1-10]PLB17587.1 MAG: Cystein rich CPCC domain containing protein [Flavobacteriaceae bacterium FS1-H7996/R]